MSAKEGGGGQAKLDVHIWLKFDKYLSGTAEIWQAAAINSYKYNKSFKSTEETVFNVRSSLLEVILGTSLEIQNRITTV